MAYITNQAIDLCKIVTQMHDPKAGALVLFSGEVRNHSNDKVVTHLNYECHIPIANKIIEGIIQDAKATYQLHQAFCVHRIGEVKVSESAVLVITASSHRSEAYAANRYIIDRVKHEAPIWKKEYFQDGSIEWGHNCSCHQTH